MPFLLPESQAVASCDNFDEDILLRTTDCQNFTLFPGDVLYLPKAVIHFATTDPDQISAHLTVSIDRDHRTWQELITTAALVTDNVAAGLVQETLKEAANTYLGMPWYMLPSHDHEEACRQLTELVLGFEPWSLRSLLRSTKKNVEWISPLATSQLLQQLGRCSNDLGKDLNGTMVTGKSLVHHTSLEIKQRQRRAVVNVNCGNTCICRSCNGNSCDGCVSIFDRFHGSNANGGCFVYRTLATGWLVPNCNRTFLRLSIHTICSRTAMVAVMAAAAGTAVTVG